MDCVFDGTSLTHTVRTDHRSNGTNPDNSFFICNNHMMSSMGQVDGYSVSAFWPRQEFDFAQGGTVEWDVNVNDHHSRSFWEVMIVPRDEMLMSSAADWLPIDEHYPKDRIVFQFGTAGGDSGRRMHVGADFLPPNGIVSNPCCGIQWRSVDPNDPALTDRRIRRKNRITIANNKIDWSIIKQDGTPHTVSMDIPGGLPFNRGLVVFKTHAYTPVKDGTEVYTFHWDNIRFSGLKLNPYEAFEAPNEVIKLRNGVTGTQIINLPHVGVNPVLTGQTHFGPKGAIKLSVNGNPDILVNPLVYDWKGTCFKDGWGTFRTPINPAYLKAGDNTLKWTYGPEPPCSETWWPNYSAIKATEVEFDGAGNPSPQPIQTPVPTPIPQGPITIDFNNNPIANLNGQSPSGIVNWDGNSWVISGPWKSFNTNNLGFRSQSVSSGTFSLLQSRTVTGIDAFNGGTVASTVTLSCSGNPTKSVSVAVDQLMNIQTGWTNPCTTVTLTSSNAWNTNFDNLSLGSLNGSSSPQPSTTPSIQPSPSSQASPNPSPAKPGDITGINGTPDGNVDIFDYNLLLGNFGKTGTNLPGDINNNGTVDIFDYNTLLGNFGK